MAKFKETIKQRSGMVLGGIGTGSVELFPDGELHEWQIYNTPRWAARCHETKVDDGEEHCGALAFYLRTEKENEVVTRRLGFRCENEEFTWRMFTAVKPIEEIDFDCRFPVCDLTYHDKDLPIAVTSRFISPFVPHQEELSASPAFSSAFTLTNPTDKEVKATLVVKVKSDFCSPVGKTHTLTEDTDYTCLSIESEQTPEANSGSIALSVTGDGESSYILGDYTRYLDEYISHSSYGLCQESFLFPMIETGKLPNTKARRKLPENFFSLNSCSEEDLDKKLATLADYAFTHSLLSRIRAVYPQYPNTEEEKEEFIAICQRQVRDIKEDFGGAALAKTLTLAPGESKTVRFLYSWFFPNHYAEDGKTLGHYYENLYQNALDVNQTLAKQYESVFGAAETFSALLYQSTLPDSYPDAWTIHLGTLIKDSWWVKDGLFGLWEGLGFCGFATTDITYHASCSLVAIFPLLQKKQMKMTAAHQREDGRMPHFFTPDLYHVDNGFHRVDMNPQFVLLSARDYFLNGDKEHLASVWENIVAAMKATAALDENNDGLPDSHTTYNTYDAWHFKGTPAYISFLWLSALKAAATLAKAMGDFTHQAEWEALLDKGKASLESLLWNGNYYDLWALDNGERDTCLMTNQLDGEIFLRLIGLEGNLSDERFEDVLLYIFAHNFKKGEGLINATCPQDQAPTMFTYKNCQAEARWTGVAYLFASALDLIGEQEKASEVIQTVHECQSRLGYFFNHWECGFRYTRPLSSWTTLLGASGFSMNQEEKSLSLLPKTDEDITLPVVTADGTGSIALKENTATLTCHSGEFILNQLELPKRFAKLKAYQALPTEKGVAVSFPTPLVLSEGESVTLS